ncbi:type VII secretion integral membrane protein EccD [Candidatus Mycolicibacterium alkanivorans]|uniref:Type VII secretion integral membrane protein EccD n=1 Tax=Candidatus Mycolicibacterium alkanivorans TaxID=2954114 RepID=A0ABS9Z0C0_9MYCO|nr:type VII secretion integral membrane protein EccD [Candidatus Mycolicibacterium alkanivorans]MCI4676945.1 type VII secretion integral membrane protein EccD [Candidatus Mycolicibacterium alkanivorans]
MVASSDTCRVTIRSAHRDTDLAVPTQLPLCEVLPSVLDVVGDDLGGRDVRLARVDGTVLEPDRSLAACAVHDGEVLILTARTHEAPPPRFDLGASVADAVTPTKPALSVVTMVGVLWSAAAVAVLLGHGLFDYRAGDLGAAGTATAAALMAAILLQTQPAMSAALGLAGAALAGLTALLAAPGLPGVLLAMSAVSATSLIVWRCTGCATEIVLPVAATTMAAAAAFLAAALGWLPATSVGPMLTTTSLAVLTISPRLAARLAGLSSSAWPDDVEDRARSAHRMLALLVAASAAAAALGASVTAVLTARPTEAACFIAAVAATLLLRARTYTDRYPAAALLLSSAVAVSALLATVVRAAPWTTPWLCGPLMAAAAAAILLGSTDLGTSPAADRVVAAVEFASGAAVVPLGCAAAGLFSTIRALL